MRNQWIAVIFVVFWSALCYAEAPLSDKTKACLGCHERYNPGIVADWRLSRHSRTTPKEALGKPDLQHRMSAKKVESNLERYAVGCFECHGLNTDAHKDSFMHFGYKINVIVSPSDCSVCHPHEVDQYVKSKKGNAYGNLINNPVYHTLLKSILGQKDYAAGVISPQEPSGFTKQDACLACHGTVINVLGMKKIKTAIGDIDVPDLENWPNQGVGRINPDGSKGACTSCHARHAFSIEVARKPYTCGQCHLEPDVPAYNVYSASKHGNIFFSNEDKMKFDSVPWTLGEDFTVPTCATCHVSLVVAPDGKTVIAERSHDFGARLWVRLFGLVYSHPQPRAGDTTVIRNKDGLPLPTTFAGEPALEYLITPDEQAQRQAKMEAVCRGCHNSDWINRHFAKLNSTIKETDAMTISATNVLADAWKAGVADPKNPFDEPIEQKWISQWLFYANTARYASAMTGAQDYIAFKYGWWGLSTNLLEMKEKLDMKKKLMHSDDD